MFSETGLLQPLLLTTTVYAPEVGATYEAAAAPAIGAPSLNHWLLTALFDVSVTLPPLQNSVSPFGVIAGWGGMAETVTPTPADMLPMQPFAVTCTVYVPAVAAFTNVSFSPGSGEPFQNH